VEIQRQLCHRSSVIIGRRLIALSAQFREPCTNRGKIVNRATACHGPSRFSYFIFSAEPSCVSRESRSAIEKMT
jgi:hypothetical protein